MSKDWGSKAGSGGVASASEANVQRRERLRQLALDNVDISQDPYFMKNHLGSYECRLCYTLHTNEGSYLAHTQAKKHQTNLARRAAKLSKDEIARPAEMTEKKRVAAKKVVKIGRPGYKVVKQRDPETGQRSLLFQLHYPSISAHIQPRHRFMSTFEQNVEKRDEKVQYLLVAAEPYETVAFAIPNRPIDRSPERFFTQWDADSNYFYIQFYFLLDEKEKEKMKKGGVQVEDGGESDDEEMDYGNEGD